MADTTELDAAITDAAEQLLKETEGEKSDEVVEETQEGTEEAPAPSGDELSEDEIKEAKILYGLLKDPRQRLNIVAALAQDSGLLQNKPLDTLKQVEKVEKGIAKLIEEALPEYPGLSTKLGPVIEQIVQAERDSREAEMQQVHVQQVEQEVTSELSVLARETKGESRKLENKMAALMSEVQPGPNVSVKSYIRMLYRLATADGTEKKITNQIADKIRRNANNAADRINGGGGRVTSSEMPTKKMNLNESVKWAIDQAYKGASKK